MLIPDAYRDFYDHRYNPNYRNLENYREMLVKDSMIVYGYDFVRRGVASRLGEYTNENPDIKDFVERAVMPAIERGLKSILSAIYWGVSISELVKKPVGDEIHLQKIYTATSQQWWNAEAFVEDENHDLEAVRFIDRTIPVYDKNGIQQLAVYTYRPEYSHFYGFATATQVYPYWYVKSRLLGMYAIYLEKNATPTKVFKVDGNDDERIQAQERNSGTAETIVVNAKTEVDILESSHAAGQEFKDGIDLMDKYILLSWYIPKLAVEEGQYSTRAQADTHLDVYLKTEENLTKDISCWLIENVVKPMVIVNFGQQEDYGSFAMHDGQEMSMQEWATLMKDLKEVGLFNAGDVALRDWAAEKFGIEFDKLAEANMQLEQEPIQVDMEDIENEEDSISQR